MFAHVHVLHPSPGLPALLAPAEPLRLLLLSELDDPDLRQWAATLSLHPLLGPANLPLHLERLDRLDRHSPPATVAAIVRHAPRRLHLVEAVLRPAPATAAAVPPYRVADLYQDQTCLRRRCVAWHDGRERSTLHLGFASDLHVAAVWNEIDAATARHAPDLHPGLLHPGRLVRRFVDTANALARAGSLDVVVFGGDLVDHVRQTADGHESADNVDYFNELVGDLVVPSFAIPGNHDYRWYPWRPRIYPYEAVSLPPPRAATILRAAGLWDPVPWRWSDLRALQTTDDNGDCALMPHRAKLAPATNYSVDLPGLRLLFLDTGRDVLPRWRGVESGRRSTFLRSLTTCWEHPDSEGIDSAQLGAIESLVAPAGGAAIFLHAPLFNPPPGSRVAVDLASSLPAAADHRAETRFESRLFTSGLRRGVFFRNPGALLRRLADARGPVSLFSGHVHRAHAFTLQRPTLTARSIDFGKIAGEHEVVFANAPAVGQTAHTEGEAPGFLLACFTEGALRRLDAVEL